MDFEQLEKASSEILTMDANKKDTLYELGILHELLGKQEKAMDYYKQIYQVDIGYKVVAEKIEQAYQ